MNHLEAALQGLEQALGAPPRSPHPWRYIVRERLGVVVEALTAEQDVATDSWLVVRSQRLHRERDRLMARLTVLAAMLEDHADLEAVRVGLRRLVEDVSRHLARMTDLVYDDVELEVGGSD